jgi:hypothetical protein
MRKRISAIFILTSLLIAFLAVSSFGMLADKKQSHNWVTPGEVQKAKLAGAERAIEQASSSSGGVQNLGFDDIKSLSPGLTVGYTTYDYQHNGRMTRQVGVRQTEMIHFDWMKKPDSALGELRGTGYEAWNPVTASFQHHGVGGGCDIHPISSANRRSGYVGLDVDTEGKVIIGNHYDEGAGLMTTLWYDYGPGNCYFSPYTRRIPDSTAAWIPFHDEEHEYIWPSHEYQVWDGDTVTHVFSQQSRDGIKPQVVAYFRRVGSDTLGSWDYPPVVMDTVADIAQMVTASKVSGKVACVWIGNLPDVPGDPESGNSGSQRSNDLFYAMSYDMGATWGTPKGTLDKFNVTKNDHDSAAWDLHTDLSCLIGTDDHLHIIWDAREWSPAGGGGWPHFYGCRLFHWDEYTNEIRVIKDANWDLPDMNYCYGGAWNEMSIVKMSISECDGKFYALFVQYNDIDHGIADDCHDDAWTSGQSSTANGELYLSVSDNGGYNWDIARDLTNSRTPHCKQGILECDSDMWPSMSRFGMQVVTGDFTGVPKVDPSGGEYANPDNWFLDVFYVNDKYPGGCVQDAGVWTYNPMKWFRIPCVPPVPNPVISFTPKDIDDPTWTKPGIPLDTTMKVENIGNAPMTIDSIHVIEVNGTPGWLGVSPSLNITVGTGAVNYAVLDVYLNQGGVITSGPTAVDGYLVFHSDAAGTGVDSFHIHLIVADSVQFPEWANIRTECTRIKFNNAGNIGNGGNPPNGGYNLNYFGDCDTTDNRAGSDDNANVYIYDMSPFILRISGGDTLLSSYIFDADWLSSDGFRPLTGLYVDSTTYPDDQYAYTGKFLTKDSAYAVEVEYFAPTAMDSCKFIVMKQRFYLEGITSASNVYVGDLMDWDIPSDSGVENGSNFDHSTGDASRDLFYCYGGEYSADSVVNNDCVLADQRLGGLAFYNGYKKPFRKVEDSLQNPAGPWWTHLNHDWVQPTGNFIGSQLYRKIVNMGTQWKAWSGGGDSSYEDLHMVAVYGKFDLTKNDTLVFVKIIAMEYDGGVSGMLSTIDKARAWIAGRPEIFTWPVHIMTCCNMPGDANNNGVINILDITYEINYVYKGGPAPPCKPEGDANGNCVINILDITYLINFVYKGGPAPICGNCPNLE